MWVRSRPRLQTIPVACALLIPARYYRNIRGLMFAAVSVLELPDYMIPGYRGRLPLTWGTNGSRVSVATRMLIGAHGMDACTVGLARPIPERLLVPWTVLWLAVRLQRTNDYCALQERDLEGAPTLLGVYDLLWTAASLGLLERGRVSVTHACAVSTNFITLLAGAAVPLSYHWWKGKGGALTELRNGSAATRAMAHNWETVVLCLPCVLATCWVLAECASQFVDTPWSKALYSFNYNFVEMQRAFLGT